jgi:hypothetical protein
MIRGLALRSLCSLRLDTVVEYSTAPLKVPAQGLVLPSTWLFAFQWSGALTCRWLALPVPEVAAVSLSRAVHRSPSRTPAHTFARRAWWVS